MTKVSETRNLMQDPHERDALVRNKDEFERLAIRVYNKATLHPTPYTLHPTPYTLHPTPYICIYIYLYIYVYV